jgi:glycosyltransferase involved in cell wall biosynthesis
MSGSDRLSGHPARICVIGPGMRFLSGVSYYTACLCSALDETNEVSAVLMRRLLPRRWYPGRERVGAPLSRVSLPPSVRSYDGVDWFWLPSLLGALWFIIRHRPRYVVFQWWTGAVLHTYLALAILARLLRAHVVIEFHEAQDVGEAERRWVRAYVHRIAPFLFWCASRFVVHSAYDRSLISEQFGIETSDVTVIQHAAYSHYRGGAARTRRAECNLLNFGVIRSFKGVEDLVRAFDGMPPAVASNFHLTVVGETWEGWTLPGELIRASRYRDRITFVNRYVSDDEVDAAFAAADIVVLPYRRSSQSGPLHVAMDYGLPVVVTAVGGLVEAVAGYEGAVLVEPGDPGALADAIGRAQRLVGKRFRLARDWSATARQFRALLDDLDAGPAQARNAAEAAGIGGA